MVSVHRSLLSMSSHLKTNVFKQTINEAALQARWCDAWECSTTAYH